MNAVSGGAVASWLARSTLERALWVRALAGDIVLCSWASNFTLTVPLSTQVYKWVPANLMLGGVEILAVASCYKLYKDKLRPDGPLGPNADSEKSNFPFLILNSDRLFFLSLSMAR